MPIGRDLQEGLKQQTRSDMWWHDLDWCVVAHERVGSVVSVNFNPPSPLRFRERNPPPSLKSKSYELEDA